MTELQRIYKDSYLPTIALIKKAIAPVKTYGHPMGELYEMIKNKENIDFLLKISPNLAFEVAEGKLDTPEKKLAYGSSIFNNMEFFNESLWLIKDFHEEIYEIMGEDFYPADYIREKMLYITASTYIEMRDRWDEQKKQNDYDLYHNNQEDNLDEELKHYPKWALGGGAKFNDTQFSDVFYMKIYNDYEKSITMPARLINEDLLKIYLIELIYRINVNNKKRIEYQIRDIKRFFSKKDFNKILDILKPLTATIKEAKQKRGLARERAFAEIILMI